MIRTFNLPYSLSLALVVASAGTHAQDTAKNNEPELYNIERIEVLKGPNSILYGESNPGGLINMRAKRPLSQDHGEFELEVGNNPSVSPRFDVGASLGDCWFHYMDGVQFFWISFICRSSYRHCCGIL